MTCCTCKQDKPDSDFAWANTAAGIRARVCKECKKDYNRRWYERHGEKHRAHIKKQRSKPGGKSHRWSLYRLTNDDYARMVADQGSKCAICKTHVDGLHVDHDHISGTVRGLLCPPCNKGLGHFRDDPAFLAAAIEYLALASGSGVVPPKDE